MVTSQNELCMIFLNFVSALIKEKGQREIVKQSERESSGSKFTDISSFIMDNASGMGEWRTEKTEKGNAIWGMS